MYSLPLPHSGHISAILHFSDIHIRTGDVERSRFNDFIQVFDNLEKSLPFVQVIVFIIKTNWIVYLFDCSIF